MDSPARRPLPVQLKPLEEDRIKAIQQDFPSYLDGLVRGTPGEFLLTPAYAEVAEDIYNFQIRSDDYWLLSCPRSGTNWMQELIWLVANDCNFEKAKEITLNDRACFFEKTLLASRTYLEQMVSKDDEGAAAAASLLGATKSYFENIKRLPSPRFIRSHLPLYLLPPDLLDKTKAVYVARNPKDLVVSAFYFQKLYKIHHFEKDFDEFVEYFMRDEVIYSPYFSHVLEAWNQRHHPNLLFVFYEDMKTDLAAQIRRVADFLGKSVTDETVGKLVDHLRIDNFAKNESVNREKEKNSGMMNKDGQFIRRGKTGDWKNHLSPELNAKFDAWIEKNLADTDLKFAVELKNQD